MRVSATGLLLLIFLVVVGALATFLPTTPPVTPASAPPTQFSAERAFRHVETIAREPHPIGSPANQRVRDYILSELNNLGLAPQVQAVMAVFPKFAVAGQVENIVARLPGTGGSRAILLASPYDSVQ
jgi:hypothetical protein